MKEREKTLIVLGFVLVIAYALFHLPSEPKGVSVRAWDDRGKEMKVETKLHTGYEGQIAMYSYVGEGDEITPAIDVYFSECSCAPCAPNITEVTIDGQNNGNVDMDYTLDVTSDWSGDMKVGGIEEWTLVSTSASPSASWSLDPFNITLYGIEPNTGVYFEITGTSGSEEKILYRTVYCDWRGPLWYDNIDDNLINENLWTTSKSGSLAVLNENTDYLRVGGIKYPGIGGAQASTGNARFDGDFKGYNFTVYVKLVADKWCDALQSGQIKTYLYLKNSDGSQTETIKSYVTPYDGASYNQNDLSVWQFNHTGNGVYDIYDDGVYYATKTLTNWDEVKVAFRGQISCSDQCRCKAYADVKYIAHPCEYYTMPEPTPPEPGTKTDTEWQDHSQATSQAWYNVQMPQECYNEYWDPSDWCEVLNAAGYLFFTRHWDDCIGDTQDFVSGVVNYRGRGSGRCNNVYIWNYNSNQWEILGQGVDDGEITWNIGSNYGSCSNDACDVKVMMKGDTACAGGVSSELYVSQITYDYDWIY